MDFITHVHSWLEETACRGILAALFPNNMVMQELLRKPKLPRAYDLAPKMAATAVSFGQRPVLQ